MENCFRTQEKTSTLTLSCDVGLKLQTFNKFSRNSCRYFIWWDLITLLQEGYFIYQIQTVLIMAADHILLPHFTQLGRFWTHCWTGPQRFWNRGVCVCACVQTNAASQFNSTSHIVFYLWKTNKHDFFCCSPHLDQISPTENWDQGPVVWK